MDRRGVEVHWRGGNEGKLDRVMQIFGTDNDVYNF
jgi:hypothetical protein